MGRSEIVERVNRVVSEEFELDIMSLKPGSTLYVELGLDSLDSVDLYAAIGREFGLTIDRQNDEQVLRGIRELAQVYDFVETKLST